MPRIWLHLCARFFEARAARALRNYNHFKARAAEVFGRLERKP